MALAQQKWAESAGYYQKAMQLAPAFSFAGANRTLALYAGGQTNEAMREMRCAWLTSLFKHDCTPLALPRIRGMSIVATIAQSLAHPIRLGTDGQQRHRHEPINAVCRSLLRRYPDFDDPRAALAAAEWELGQYERAEGDWNRVQDPRYADKEWLLKTRRWPATLCEALQAFLEIRMTKRVSSAA